MTHIDRFPLRMFTVLRGHLVVPVISLHLLCFVASPGQRMHSTFGPLIDRELSYTPVGVTTVRIARPPRAEIAVLERSPARLHLYALARSGELLAGQTIPLETVPSMMLAVDLTGDGTDEIVTLATDAPELVIHRRTATGFTAARVPLDTAPERIAAADVNNDRHFDLLLYGRSMSGVRVLTGKANGAFTEGPLLFPDISVSDLSVADLNGDNIVDVVLADWLSDRLITFYGIGRGVFSEQIAVGVGAEPSFVALTPRTRSRTFAVAVSLPSRGTIGIYEGNATGELELRETFDIAGKVDNLLVAQLTPDTLPELLVLTGSSVAVAMGLSLSTFTAPVVFGPGRDLAGLAVGDLDGDRMADAVVVDRSSRRLVVLGNSNGNAGTAWPSVYAVGVDPHGLAVCDFNADGFDDIAVANQGSAHLSLLAGKGAGLFRGQETITVPPRPVFLRSTTPTGRPGRTLTTSHEDGDMVTIVRFDADSQSSSTASVPTGPRPCVLLAKEDSSRSSFEMLVRYENGNDHSLSLSLFERGGGRQFVERSLRPSAAGTVVALTVDDAMQNGSYALFFVTHDRNAVRSSLSVAMSPAGFDFRTVRRLLAYSDSSGTTSVMTGLVNRDNQKDVLLLFGPPRSSIGLLYGRGDGLYSDSLEWIRGLQPAGDDALLLHDVDGNGATDLVCLDQLLGSVVVAYQRAEGGFRVPSAVLPVPGATGICIANLRSPLQHDIIVSRGDRGTVSITFDAFRK